MTVRADDVAAALTGRPALLRDTCDRALAYLDGLAGRPVAPAAADVAGLEALDFALPGPGLRAAAVLGMLDKFGSPATVASGGPRYFGFVTGGALPIAQAAAWLTAAWDQNAGLSVMSPTASVLNGVALRWVTELVGLPAGTGGGFVTGATMANATCLAAARDAVLTRHGWDAAGPGPRHRAARRRSGPDRAARPAGAHRPGTGVPAGRQRQQRGQRPVPAADRLGA